MALNSLCYGKQAWHPVWSHSKLPYSSSHLSNRISKANLKGQYLDIHHCRVLKIVQKIFHLTIFVTVEIFDTIVRRRELSYWIIRLQNFPEKIYFETGTFSIWLESATQYLKWPDHLSQSTILYHTMVQNGNPSMPKFT